jgi:hypothetical protein
LPDPHAGRLVGHGNILIVFTLDAIHAFNMNTSKSSDDTMTHVLRLLAAALTLLLTACAAEPEKPEPPSGYFATNVTEDGTRQFQYTLEVSDSPPDRRGGRPGNLQGHAVGSSGRGLSGGVSASTASGGSRQGPGGYEAFQRINKLLENRLEAELARSGFCPSGYRETERVVEPGLIYIRGECKRASASAAIEE